MSPEQALAKRVQLDHRTDVYSLGVTLYELLTLERAFGGNDHQELLRRIASEEPVAPRGLDHTVPADLDTIVLKAMQKAPRARYRTARDLADDLQRFLDGKPIRARPVGTPERAVRWVTRHPAAAALVGAVVAAVLAITLFAAWAWRAERAAEESERAARAQERLANEERLKAQVQAAGLALDR